MRDWFIWYYVVFHMVTVVSVLILFAGDCFPLESKSKSSMWGVFHLVTSIALVLWGWKCLYP